MKENKKSTFIWDIASMDGGLLSVAFLVNVRMAFFRSANESAIADWLSDAAEFPLRYSSDNTVKQRQTIKDPWLDISIIFGNF